MDRTPLVELPEVLAAPQPRTDARYLLGVDGGATKTLAAVLDLDGGKLHLGHGGPSNEDAIGVDAAVEALLGAAREALQGAGVRAERLGAGVVAVAGTDTPSVAAHFAQASGEPWLVVNDVVGAWATATGAAPGVGVISGTGSNVFGVGRDGRAWRAGGWGHVLGDEGSGYWLGVQSVGAALHDRDGSGPPTALSEAVPRFFGTGTVEEAASLVYSKPLGKSEIAAFAVETAAVAERGDAVARGLYERGAAGIAAQILAVVERTGLDGAFPIGLLGSAFNAGEVFIGPLRRAVLAAAPQAVVSRVQLAPAIGGLLLAAHLCGRREDMDPAALGKLLEDALAAGSRP